MRVRPMTARDAAEASALSGQLGYPSTPGEIAERFERVARLPESAVFVAEETDGTIAGWIHVVGTHTLESGPSAELAGLVVDTSSRRKGAGRALVSAAEAWAVEHGFAVMRVRSNVARLEARPFYERMGYAIIKSQYVFQKRIG